MTRVCGRIKCEGIATVNPGDLVNLAGVGDRYAGKVFTTGVRHDFDTIQGWKTHVQFGYPENWRPADLAVAAPQGRCAAAGGKWLTDWRGQQQ